MKPLILTPERRLLLVWLVVNGMAQASLGIGLAVLMSEILQSSGRDGLQHTPAIMVALLFAGALLLVVLRAWQRRDAEAFGLTYVSDLRVAVFRHICSLPGSSRDPPLGALMTRLTTDLLAVKNWISYGIATSIVASVTIVGSIALLAIVDPRLAAVSAGAFVIVLLLSGLCIAPLDSTVKRSRRTRGKLANRLAEKLVSRGTIQALNRAGSESKQIEALSVELTDALVIRGLYSGFLRFAPLAALPLAICLLALLDAEVLSALATEGGAGSVETSLLAWMFVMGLAAAQLQDATRAIDYRVSFRPAMRRVDSILSRRGLEGGEADAASVFASDTLTFAIPSAGLSNGGAKLPCTQGKLTVLTGGDAALRSKLARQLAYLDVPGDGAIRCNDTELSAMPLGAYRRHVVLVAPDLGLLKGTIGGNFRKAGVDPSALDHLRNVLRICGLKDQSDDLETFLDLRVGNHGRFISAAINARTRLAIALARAPRLLIIDDPDLAAADDVWSTLIPYAESNRLIIVTTQQPEFVRAQTAQQENISDWQL